MSDQQTDDGFDLPASRRGHPRVPGYSAEEVRAWIVCPACRAAGDDVSLVADESHLVCPECGERFVRGDRGQMIRVVT